MSNINLIVNNNSITKYYHHGDVFVEGRPGSNFSIEIRNPHSNRVKAVVSVDGINIIDGKSASENGRGYVLDGYQVITIRGWRINDNNVRKFYFGEKNDSYSNRTGYGTQNVGVIGVAFYDEDVSWNISYNSITFDKPWHESRTKSVGWVDTSRSTARNTSSINMVGAATATSMNNLGTGMGSIENSQSRSVGFKARDYAFCREIIYYDDIKGLEKRGIDVRRINYKPDPFPASNGFCKQV